jgi:hypothetical protein
MAQIGPLTELMKLSSAYRSRIANASIYASETVPNSTGIAKNCQKLLNP